MIFILIAYKGMKSIYNKAIEPELYIYPLSARLHHMLCTHVLYNNEICAASLSNTQNREIWKATYGPDSSWGRELSRVGEPHSNTSTHHIVRLEFTKLIIVARQYAEGGIVRAFNMTDKTYDLTSKPYISISLFLLYISQASVPPLQRVVFLHRYKTQVLRVNNVGPGSEAK